MGFRLNRLDEPVFMAVSKPLLTEFDIHLRLESCESSTFYEVILVERLVAGGATKDVFLS